MTQQQDLETVVNALLKGIKSQSTKKEVKHSTWVEKRFGIPKSGEEILWRVCWLIVIPSVFTLCYLPIADWCWYNKFPLVPILTSVALALLYWAIASFAINSADKLQRLVEMQMAIPPSVVFFLIVWEMLRRG